MSTNFHTVLRYMKNHYKGVLAFLTITVAVLQYMDQNVNWDEILDIEYLDNFPIKEPHGVMEVHHHEGETEEAEKLSREIRIICFILTYPEDTKAIYVKETWGKRCNKLVFLSSESNPALGAINLKVGEGRNVLWGKSRAAFKYMYDNFLDEYDWFFKGDTDTYVILENMRYMLSAYDPSFPIYFGSRFKMFCAQGYMSGGGGYVLSREAVKQFVEKALPDNTVCKQQPTGAEDAEMGKCLDHIGVLAGDSRDGRGRGRMFPFNPETHLLGYVPKWYLDYVYYQPDVGLNCCSDRPVTFHYIKPEEMYKYDYFLYHVRRFGVSQSDPFPAPLPLDKKSIPKDILIKNEDIKSE